MSYVWQRWIPREFRAAGLTVIEVDGWQNRGRPASTGHFDPRAGVTDHHTGTTSSKDNPAPSLQTLIVGRSDLPGPLCQWAVDWLGRVWVIAAGRANHAGSVGKAGVAGFPLGADGNALAMGDEVMTDGTQALTAAQVRSIAVTNAVVLRHIRQDVSRIVRHADISGTGKWDIGNRTTAQLRDDATPFMRGTTEEDDMPRYTEWSQEDREALVNDILNAPLNVQDPKGEEEFRGVTLRAAVKELIRATGAKVKRRQ